MGRLEQMWDGLSRWQKFVASAIGVALIGTPVSAGMTWVGEHVSFLGFLIGFGHVLIKIITATPTVYVIGGMALGAFGPSIWNLLKRIDKRSWLGLLILSPIVFGIVFFMYVIISFIYHAVVDSTYIYSPPHQALVDHNGKSRIFFQGKISDLNAPFADATSIVAHQEIHRDIGKWIAVTGAIEEIESSPISDSLEVTVGNSATGLANMEFSDAWASQVQKRKKGTRIYAICKIENADEYNIYLTECELAPP